MQNSHRLKLFLMMVLEFFIWGAWLPLIYGYLPTLGFSPAQQACILNAFPVAAIVGMFFGNQFADRNFAAEKFLAFSQLVGGLAVLGLAFTRAFWPFFGLMLVHCLFYVPTLSITNSIAFANMKDPRKEFGLVRMGGSIGWILAAWPFTFIFVDWGKVHAANPHGLANWLGTVLGSGLTGEALKAATASTYVVAGAASLLLAAFSFLLPPTPPRRANSELGMVNSERNRVSARRSLALPAEATARKAEEGAAEPLAWLEAVKLLRHPFVLVLWLVTLVDSFVQYSYFNWTGTFLGAAKEAGGVGIAGNWIMPVMSLGQIAEILTMLILGATLKRLGWRATLTIGILGQAARFAVYAFFPQHKELIILVQLLHGICYAFFFATVYIFVDAYFPKDARASAQGLFNVMYLGIGALLANSVCPYLIQTVFAPQGITHFRGLFLVPTISAIAAGLALVLFFHPPKMPPTEREL
jgi:MFS family permease